MILSLGIQRLLPVPTYWSRHQVLTRRTISRRHPVVAVVEVEVTCVVVQGEDGENAETEKWIWIRARKTLNFRCDFSHSFLFGSMLSALLELG
jgi:hypothetical protein